jgi:diaminohydroxyphosphoribosylaminopyrimidine deaminase/5-amino-6-(5-phosphoribosylamino)uracil reductase
MDKIYMAKALELARKGLGYTNPNPIVGALLVKEGKIIGEGYHQCYGGPHAEINAFRNATEDVQDAVMYVTLEPCSHYGKTPPCVNTIIEKKIKKVVIAMKDPNPIVAGRGIQILRNHGIEVVTGVLEKEAQKQNEVFIKYITYQQPFCVLKTAMTLDGKIAAYTGDSKWISDETSRKIVHQLRHRFSSIMVGIGTILADDPLLTTRLEGQDGKDPIRIIIDTYGRIPLNAKVLQLPGQTILATTQQADREKLKTIEKMNTEILITPMKNQKVDLSYVVQYLGQQKIDSILLEGGSTLNYSALNEGIVDKIICFIAPKIIGGEKSKTPVGGQGKPYMKDAFLFKNMTIVKLENDFMIQGYPKKEE